MKDAEAHADSIMKELNLANPDDEKPEGAGNKEDQGNFFWGYSGN